MPYLFLGLWLMAVISRAPGGLRSEHWYPHRWTGWALFVLILPLGLWSALLAVQALRGRSPPASAKVIDLSFPVGPDAYLVSSGGATEIVNGHSSPLNPKRIDNGHTGGSPMRLISSSLVHGAFAHQAGDPPTLRLMRFSADQFLRPAQANS